MTVALAKEGYTVRRLTTNDLFTMVKILTSISGEVRGAIQDLKTAKIDQQLFGFILIEAAMKHAEGHLKTLLADVVGLSLEEFEKEPFDAPLTIIGIVAEQEDLKDFLQKAQNLMKKFSGK